MNRIKTNQVPVVLDHLQDVGEAIKAYSFVLLIKTDKVEYLHAEDATDLARLTELRAHTEEKELHLVKAGNRWVGRVRTDGEGEETEYMDEMQCLWGKAKSFDGRYSRLREDKGVSLDIPLEVPMGKGAYMTVRSYLDKEDFSFTDYRIVGLAAEGGESVG